MAETIAAGVEGLQVSKTKELKGTEKRDSLREWEVKAQQMWEEAGLFHADAPSTDEVPFNSVPPEELREKFPKWFGTIAYPYANGVLHVGHGFSFSKVEFTAGFERMRGRRVLWPQGYHCTGLPIKVCADKLANEVKMFGQEFENYTEEEEVVLQPGAAAPVQGEDVTKFKAQKGKLASKTVRAKYQFQIMLSMGIPRQEIHRFSDAQYWLEYFPPRIAESLVQFGSRIDWRRSMVTTDANPFYDVFIRWQMRKLRSLGKIKFGSRYTIYSVKDGQPCMDHDRDEGEALGPQEYTAIKLRVLEFSPKFEEAVKGKLPENSKIFLVAATLRPETMFGQTCCFIGPKLPYCIVKAKENEYYVVTERAAKNMAFQNQLAKDFNVPEKLATLQGSDMVGSLVNAPLSVHKDGVRVLPMDGVLPGKGSGVVTCVPSDSPDDYAQVTELAKKPDFYGIKKEWAEPEIVPIIETQAYGNLAAPFLVKKLKISSPKDVIPLKEAKELAYKEGFYNGTMIYGPFKGEKVEAAKPKVRQALIDAGEAFAYAEPEGRVVSRSGDECIVALMDQWYLDYGEESWRKQALDYVANEDGKGLNTYSPEAQHNFKGVLNWLNQWALSRSYGLGTKLPWDESSLVESLSDSTIYMAYYTIIPFLHKDLFGRVPGSGNIAPEQMTDAVFDYIFALAEMSDDATASGIPKETLESMRRSFEYFYPLDLRCSGKDLVPNHLIFFLYNHLAIWPEKYWPRGIRVNGHLVINGEKMSKSKGNFLTFTECISKYGADATRICMADAGDTIADSNFEEDVADASVLGLYTKRELFLDLAKDQDQLRTGPLNNFQDALFENELHLLTNEAWEHYSKTSYKLALQTAWFQFASAWSFYKEQCAAAGIQMHKDLVFKYIELQALVMTPIASHWAEFIYLEILKKPQSIQLAQWPEMPAAKAALTAELEFVRTTMSSVNSAVGAAARKKAKGKETGFDPKKPKMLTIYTTKTFPEWQDKYIELLKAEWDPSTKAVKDEKGLIAKVSKMGEVKKAMPFVQVLKRRLQTEDASKVLDRKLAFDEQQTLLAMVPGIKRSGGYQAVVVVECEEGKKVGKDLTGGGAEIEVSQVAENVLPGTPTFKIENKVE